jgi:effector-binding domain-containing protein
VERAQAIRALRDLQLSMEEIKDALGAIDDGRSLAEARADKRARLAEEAAASQRAVLALDALMRHEAEAQAYLRAPPPITSAHTPERRVAFLRARGRYADASSHFPRLFAAVAPHVVGPPFCLFHDAEYKEEDADISFCVPVQSALDAAAGVSLETHPACTHAVIVHTGPYDSEGPSWARLFAHVRALGREVHAPLRETYLQGPGTEPIVTELAVRAT